MPAGDAPTFFLRKCLSILALGKKIPQTICAKSCLSQALRVGFQAAPFKGSTAAEQAAHVFCLQEAGGMEVFCSQTHRLSVMGSGVCGGNLLQGHGL